MSLPPLFYCYRWWLQLLLEVEKERAEVGQAPDGLHAWVFDGARAHLPSCAFEGVATVERAGTKGEKRRR